MRNNGPTSGREVVLAKNEEIVSSSDPRGNIVFVNETFCKISGFSEAELLGQPHNIIRHPQMPPAAFASLWERLKRGEPWMGLVKNRCKNGDHYWVDAYVTPVREKGAICGYESVRIKADPRCVARAERIYSRLNAGRSAFSWRDHWSAHWRGATVLGVVAWVMSVVTAALFYDPSATAALALLLPASLLAVTLQMLQRKLLTQPLEQARAVIHDPLAAYVYTGGIGPANEIALAQLALHSRLRTALGRFRESATLLKAKGAEVNTYTRQTFHGMAEQQRETDGVARAMERMAGAVQNVASGASQTSTTTRQATEEVAQGHQVVNSARGAIDQLATTVGSLNEMIGRLSADSGQIAQVVSVIRGIAEQTNLLALNAAIEAARAGEQGRGFAVVADEVRNLAQRTAQSTAEIRQIIEAVQRGTQEAVRAVENGRRSSEQSVEQVGHAGEILGGVSRSVETIRDMNRQIATAAEEQTQVADDISRNLIDLAGIAASNQESVQHTAHASQSLHELSSGLAELTRRLGR